MGTSVGIDPEEKDRLAALAKWARRVVQNGEIKGIDARRAVRSTMNAEMSLIPIDQASLRPNLRARINVVGKDFSETGVGIVSNQMLDDSLYFCEITGQAGIYLIRRARERSVRGSIREYGFMILDRYDSYQDLREV